MVLRRGWERYGRHAADAVLPGGIALPNRPGAVVVLPAPVIAGPDSYSGAAGPAPIAAPDSTGWAWHLVVHRLFRPRRPS
ncbi:protein of unknown function [Blastococcus saxobsidens DD2]|uniref:Uncharacterized protein n=1 Tax=Blastococcus saxobsidens (strain DD2) TaxID=1146883 RepID=H6RUB0_BLASD|nr:protein of unknown function [Blastococcus saxobsidens DD2]